MTRAQRLREADAKNGVCCSCGFSGEEETECSVRPDRTHCVHWWEGPDSPAPGIAASVAIDAYARADEVSRLKAGVVVEPLTEEECNSIVDEWASAPFPDGDYTSNTQKENAGFRQLAEMAAEAQRKKARG
jgi:hypothetical protein